MFYDFQRMKKNENDKVWSDTRTSIDYMSIILILLNLIENIRMDDNDNSFQLNTRLSCHTIHT